MTLTTLIDAPPWRVDMAPSMGTGTGTGAGPDLILAFASIGHDPTRPPSPEFVASSRAQGRRALFFMDAARSWGLDPAFPAILHRALAAAGPAQRRLAIGSSMGAAMALRAAAHAPLDAILAFGPQSRLHDPRWSSWTARLSDPGPPPLPQGPWTVLFHALDDDRDQALGFPQQPGTDHLLFPGLTHSRLGPYLKERGLLSGLIDAALARDRRRLLRIATAAGGVQRRKRMPA
jgi:hypothetical protein